MRLASEPRNLPLPKLAARIKKVQNTALIAMKFGMPTQRPEKASRNSEETRLLQIRTRNAAVVGKRTTAVYAEGGRYPLSKCVSRSQK